jgi:hypothetical protein
MIHELSERTRAVIGENGVRRLEGFATYRAGWHQDGGGEPLSPDSVRRLDEFVSSAEFWSGLRPPSVFFDRGGFPVLAWDDSSGERLEIEFSDPPLFFRSSDDKGTPLPEIARTLTNGGGQ